jgi:hypothetical protein
MSTTSEMATYLQAYLETGFFMGSALVARSDEVLLNQSYGMANLEHGVLNTPQINSGSLRSRNRLQQ